MALKGIGTENKKRVYQLGALVVIMLGIAAWEIFGGSSTPPPASAPAAPAVVTTTPPAASNEAPQETTTAGAYAHPAAKVGGLAALDPTLHPEVMRQAESLEYTGLGRNIFSLTSTPTAIPKPVASVRQVAVDTGPPPPPPPPPITLGFYGYASEKSGQKQVFLLHGDDIFIASEGDIVDRRYRVVKIGPASIQVEDIPYHNTQTLPLRQ
jgi:hypothetical protein